MGTEEATIGPVLALEDDCTLGNPVSGLKVVLISYSIAADLRRAAPDEGQCHKYWALRWRLGTDNGRRLWRQSWCAGWDCSWCF